jgi:hypothetical protein
MSKSISERWAEYHILGANRFLPPVLFAVSLVFFAVGAVQGSRGVIELAVLLLFGAFQAWERVGVHHMLKRANFNWDGLRA